MKTDQEISSLIQTRLDIGAELDQSARLSFMQRAQLRLKLVTIVSDLENGRSSPSESHEAMRRLQAEVAATIESEGSETTTTWFRPSPFETQRNRRV